MGVFNVKTRSRGVAKWGIFGDGMAGWSAKFVGPGTGYLTVKATKGAEGLPQKNTRITKRISGGGMLFFI